MLKSSYRNLFLLHFMVIIFGFTGIIGALIQTSTWVMIWYRMILAAFFIALYAFYKKKKFNLNKKLIFKLIGVGLIIAAHWITFYGAIKVSNVSVTLACFATGSFFAALLEPLVYKRKVNPRELFFGVLVFVGIGFIFSIETKFINGIILSICSAFLAALFTVFNGKLANEADSSVISVYEMFGGFLGLSILFAINGNLNADFLHVIPKDWPLLLVLAIFCTAFTFVLGVTIMKELSPYTVVLAVNLEPVYSIILAYFILNEGNELSYRFYLGAFIILLTVFANSFFKPKNTIA
jgi:drug/metabolite transporter (DMT)-like permease